MKPKVDSAKKKLDPFLDVAVLDVNSLAAALFAGPAFDPHHHPNRRCRPTLHHRLRPARRHQHTCDSSREL